MKIFHAVAVGAVLAALQGEAATVCTWIGPTQGDGRWSVAANWEDGRMPAGGEAVDFSSGTASTNDIGEMELSSALFSSGPTFALAGKKLSFSAGSVIGNAASVSAVHFFCPVELKAGAHTSTVDKLWFKEAVSGDGDLNHSGSSLSFTKNLPDYTGSIFATNAVLTPHREHTYGHLPALGKRNEIHAKRLVIYGNGTWFDVTSTNYLYASDSSQVNKTLHNYCGDVKMSGPLYFLFEARVCFNGMIFESPVRFTTRILVDPGANNRNTYFNGLLRPFDGVDGTVHVPERSVLHFATSGNVYTQAEIYGTDSRMVFGEANAMSPSARYAFYNAKADYTAGIVVERGDQTCQRIASGKSFVNTYVTSAVPVSITVKGDYSHSFGGRWQGETTLVWSPTWAAEYELSTPVEHLTTGRLVSKCGKLILTAGSSFPNLSGLECRDNGSIKVPAGVTFNPAMKEVCLAGTGSLELGDDVHVTVDDLWIDGKRCWGPRVYGGAACAVACRKTDRITGTGSVKVLTPNPFVMTVFVR